MSIIIDGMDQNSTNLPHMKRLQKSDVNLWYLRTHLTGVIVHGHGTCCYLDFQQWPHDPNLTCNLLIKVYTMYFSNHTTYLFLQVISKYFSKLSKTHKPLPKKLFLQLDNTARENKNRCVLAFLSLLVHYGIFDEVY